jgi:hypothetical protein
VGLRNIYERVRLLRCSQTMDVRVRHDTLERLSVEWLRLMRQGRSAEAWQISDRVLRLRRGMDCSSWPRHLQFVWDGTPIESRRVLVRCYHGFGDTIQFARLLPLLRERAAKVTLWAQPHLMPVLSHAEGFDELIPLHDGCPEADYDVDIELSELMHVLRVDVERPDGASPYLKVDPCPERAPAAELEVGLVWSSGNWDERRTIPCELFKQLRDIARVKFWLFQRGPALGLWRNDFGFVPRIGNVLDEARAMRRLSLLISADTFSAHLAGALGVEVWTLLHSAPDWRWMQDRCDCPWYPTMRLFRQQKRGEWRPVIADVRRELTKLAATRA